MTLPMSRISRRGARMKGGVPGRRSRVGRGDGTVRVAAGGFAQRGYTLIEVIVAFGVLALGLTLLLGTLSGATRQIRYADESGRAALHAQSLLDQVGVGETLQPGERTGDFEDGRYRWVLSIEPYIEAAAQSPQPVALAEPQLMQLALTVRWGDNEPRQRLQLRSLRLVAPSATDGVALP